MTKPITDLISHCGVPHKKPVRTINAPVYSGSTVLFDSYEAMAAAKAGRYDGITYGTDGLPNQRAFERALCELDGGALTRAFPSGISAIRNTLLMLLRSGDHVLMVENVYGPTADFCQTVLSRFGIETTPIPGNAGAEIAGLVRPETRLIFLESPGSNTFEIQDIPAITRMASQKGIITVLDNTWATPLLLNAFALGVDVVIQSATKYISGHSDILLGAVSVNESLAKDFARTYRTMEICAPSQECQLALRGLMTLPARLAQHQASALTVAHWLNENPVVDRVLHPALDSHPQHDIWKRDFLGASGLFAFTFKAVRTKDDIASFINALALFGIGFSWGGFKSLVTAGTYPRSTDPDLADTTIIRLNIGLEDPQDLIDDLDRAMAAF